MGRIFYLMGKSSSGKDTIFKELLRDSGSGQKLRTIVTYTTRPIRAGERDGVEYYFTDEEGFQRRKDTGKVVEEREYHTCHGLWRYFTVDDGQFERESTEDYIMIGTLESYCSMKRYYGVEAVVPILIELDDGVRLQRALNRERKQKTPKYEEMCRRFLADSADFSDEKIEQAGIRRRFQNQNLKTCLAQIRAYLSGV